MFPVDGAFVNSTAAARANGYLGGYGTRTEREVDLPRMGLSAQAQERLQRR
jgi:peptide-methionine (S)-S-oxide reductase